MADKQLGTIQGPADTSGGKRIANAVITLPAGTLLTAADGTTSALSADTPVYLQRIVIGDPDDNISVSVTGEDGRGKLGVDDKDAGERLASIDESLQEIKQLLEMVLS